MNAPVTITAALDADTVALVDELANARGITGAEFAAAAIRRALDLEIALRDGLDAADAQIDRGEYLTQEQMQSWLQDRRRSRH